MLADIGEEELKEKQKELDSGFQEGKSAIYNPYAVPTRNLRKTIPMMRGNDVKWLQFELGITVDGMFGKQTKAAVINFQKRHSLKVDGIVGPATRYALLHQG